LHSDGSIYIHALLYKEFAVPKPLSSVHTLLTHRRGLRRIVLLSLVLAVVCNLSADTSRSRITLPLDIMLVVDTSGSMKRHDPGFLTKKVVTDVLEELPGHARVGVLLFAQHPDLAMPLTAVDDQQLPQQMAGSLQKVTYRGRRTDSAAAVERVLYELKHHGRQDVQKVMLLMTDGMMDVGSRTRDRERVKWLKESLAEACRQASIRIFSVAFARTADFELLQTLGQKTGGDYYRVFTAQDVTDVLRHIRQAIAVPYPAVPPPQPASVPQTVPETPPASRSVPEAAPQLPPPPPPAASGFPIQWLPVAILAALVIAAAVLGVVLHQLRRLRGQLRSTPVVEKEEPIPTVELRELDSVNAQKAYTLAQKVTRIGRAGREGVTVPIDAATVSDPHAEIRYMDQHFYLIDLNSTNGTYLNNATTRLPKYVPILLKSGDVITFDLYKFEFNRAQHGKRGVTQIRQVPRPAVPHPVGAAEPTSASMGQDRGSATALMEAPRAAVELPVPPAMCTVHSIIHATGVCTVCKKAYCLICLVHTGTQQVCVQCAKR